MAIHDQDPLFIEQFRALLSFASIESARIPPRNPNLNAYAERFVRSIKEECLSKIIPLGERHLRKIVQEYAEHYHLERHYQCVGNELIDGEPEPELAFTVETGDRLGGVLRSYHRAA